MASVKSYVQINVTRILKCSILFVVISFQFGSCSKSKPMSITAIPGLRLHESPSITSKSIAFVKYGELVDSQGETGEEEIHNRVHGRWHKIIYGGKEGYVFGGFLKIAGGGTASKAKQKAGSWSKTISVPLIALLILFILLPLGMALNRVFFKDFMPTVSKNLYTKSHYQTEGRMTGDTFSGRTHKVEYEISDFRRIIGYMSLVLIAGFIYYFNGIDLKQFASWERICIIASILVATLNIYIWLRILLILLLSMIALAVTAGFLGLFYNSIVK